MTDHSFNGDDVLCRVHSVGFSGFPGRGTASPSGVNVACTLLCYHVLGPIKVLYMLTTMSSTKFVMNDAFKYMKYSR